MKRLYLIAGLIFLASSIKAVTFSDFYVQTAGNNLNAGSTTDDAAIYTGASGNWTNDTSVSVGTWFKSGEDLSGVSAGMWASVYPDAALTNGFVALITAVSDGDDTITLSLTAKGGTKPDTVVAGATIKVGGAWKGPNKDAAYVAGDAARWQFPFNFVAASMTNVGGFVPFVNFRNDAIYSFTNALTHANPGPIWFGGYSVIPRDGGKAIFDATNALTGIVLLTVNAASLCFQDLIFQNNGPSGTSDGVSAGGAENFWNRCVARNIRGRGFYSSYISASSLSVFNECEVYNYSIGSQASPGFHDNNTSILYNNCIAHHVNTVGGTPTSSGFYIGAVSYAFNCISVSNGVGFTFTGTTINNVVGCDAWGNVLSGFNFSGSGAVQLFLKNCNSFKNGGMGVQSSGGSLRNGMIANCAFGSGTQTNALGNIDPVLSAGALSGVLEVGTITYPADETPWVDPTVGNFSPLTGAAGRAAGLGSFVQWGTNGPTISRPDIGAAQAASTNAVSSGGEHSHVFAQ